MSLIKRLSIIACVLSAPSAVSAAGVPTAAAGAEVRIVRCEDLAGIVIAPTEIGLPTKGAIVTSAVRASATAPAAIDGEAIQGINAHCEIQGRIDSVTAGAPPINFNINLPLRWNGVAIQSGGGGMGGTVITSPGKKGSGMLDPDSPAWPYRINTGYVTFGSDEGHPKEQFTNYFNDEVIRNWAADYVKKVHDVALKIVSHAYGVAPRRLYFTGESAGGRESLRAAQRFGDDYDGFIATSPVLYWTVNHLLDNVLRSRLIDGWIDEAAIKTIADRTRQYCDEMDGLKDGIVARYMACHVPDAALRCPTDKSAKDCLSDAQMLSLNTMRQPWKVPAGLTFPFGITEFPGYGTTGEEDDSPFQYDYYPIGKVPPSKTLPPNYGFEKDRGGALNFAQLWTRYAIAQDPAFNVYNFDPLPYAKRIRYLADLFDALDPSLVKLEKHGSKLILFEPSADSAASLQPVAAYYNSVLHAMGRARTDGVMRFYVGPGGGHNVTGTSHVDLLKVMEDWVDRGITPPTTLRAEKVDLGTLKVTRTMPACLFPAYARYRGRGNVNDASSFVCTSRTLPDQGSATSKR